MCLPYAERRPLLGALDVNGPAWRTPEVFDDGEALLERRRAGTASKGLSRSGYVTRTSRVSTAG